MDATIRTQFPIRDELTYKNSASVCLMPLVALEAGQLGREQVYLKRPDALDVWLGEMASTRRTVAAFVGAKAEEIAFTGNTGDGEAFVAGGLRFRPGGNIVSDDLDFPTGHVAWRETAKRFGLVVREVRSVRGTRFAFRLTSITRIPRSTAVWPHWAGCSDTDLRAPGLFAYTSN